MEKRYNSSAIILHWIQGLMILFVLLTGTFVLSQMPNTIEKIGSFKVHMILGLVIFILTIIRIVNIIKSPKLEPLQVSPFRNRLIKINHISIYVVLLFVAISGILLSKNSGLGEIVFFGSNAELYVTFKDYGVGIAHGFLTKVLIFLIFMHVVGVASYGLKRIWFKNEGK